MPPISRKSFDALERIVALTGIKPSTVVCSAHWTDARDWEAGVSADDDTVTVYYGSASAVVSSLEEAATMLKGIFADEIVCVTALEKETPIHYALARHDDPTASFTRLDRPGFGDMPAIDHVMIRSWTGKRDQD